MKNIDQTLNTPLTNSALSNCQSKIDNVKEQIINTILGYFISKIGKEAINEYSKDKNYSQAISFTNETIGIFNEIGFKKLFVKSWEKRLNHLIIKKVKALIKQNDLITAFEYLTQNIQVAILFKQHLRSTYKLVNTLESYLLDIGDSLYDLYIKTNQFSKARDITVEIINIYKLFKGSEKDIKDWKNKQENALKNITN